MEDGVLDKLLELRRDHVPDFSRRFTRLKTLVQSNTTTDIGALHVEIERLRTVLGVIVEGMDQVRDGIPAEIMRATSPENAEVPKAGIKEWLGLAPHSSSGEHYLRLIKNLAKEIEGYNMEVLYKVVKDHTNRCFAFLERLVSLHKQRRNAKVLMYHWKFVEASFEFLSGRLEHQWEKVIESEITRLNRAGLRRLLSSGPNEQYFARYRELLPLLDDFARIFERSDAYRNRFRAFQALERIFEITITTHDPYSDGMRETVEKNVTLFNDSLREAFRDYVIHSRSNLRNMYRIMERYDVPGTRAPPRRAAKPRLVTKHRSGRGFPALAGLPEYLPPRPGRVRPPIEERHEGSIHIDNRGREIPRGSRPESSTPVQATDSKKKLLISEIITKVQELSGTKKVFNFQGRQFLSSGVLDEDRGEVTFIYPPNRKSGKGTDYNLNNHSEGDLAALLKSLQNAEEKHIIPKAIRDWF